MFLRRMVAIGSSVAVSTSALVLAAAPAQAADVVGGWTSVVGANATSLNNKVYSLLQDGSTVYVGGMFTGAGGAAGSYLTSFNAATAGDWAPVASSAISAGAGYTYVAAIAKTGSDVYIGGRFGTANIAKVAGGTVTALGTGSAGGDVDVEEIGIIGTKVFAGGGFTSLGGQANTAGIGVWDTSAGTPAWAALGTGFDDDANTAKIVNGLLVDGTKLHIGGQFLGLNGLTSKRAVTWETSGTPGPVALGDGLNSGLVASLAKSGSGAVTGLFAGGTMATAGTSTAVNGLAKLSGSAWVAGAGTGLSSGGVVETMAFDSAGNLYIGGSFTSVNGVSANNIAKFDGTSWSALTCGPNNGVNSAVRGILPQSDGSIIVGGWFTNAGGFSNNKYIARYTPGTGNCVSADGPAPSTAEIDTLDFDGNGGTCSPTSKSGERGTWSKALTSDNCSRPGYLLGGFSTSPTNASGSSFAYPGGNIYFGGSNRLYAVWIRPLSRPDAPTNVVLTPALNALKVSWKAPANDGGQPVYLYSVAISKAGQSSSRWPGCTRPGTETTCTIPLPATDTKYAVAVSARSTYGASDWSAESAPASPYDFGKVEASRNNVLLGLGGSKVEWSGSAPGLTGASVTAQYKVGSAANWTTEANAAKVNAEGNYSWSKKFPFSANKQPVTVRFTYGSDAATNAFTLTRGAQVGSLSAPRNVKVDVVPNRVKVTWDPPKFDGGEKITGYIMCATSGSSLCRNVGTDGTGILDGLDARRQYTITVAAKTAKGEGPAAKAKQQVSPVEASVVITRRFGQQLSIQAEGAGFTGNAKFRLEEAIAVPGETASRWRWNEIQSFTESREFNRGFTVELDDSYTGETVAVRLVTPNGTVYSRLSRP